MEKNYYISGYTGFCPDMAHRIGQNYSKSTRDALREQPHLRGRLGDMRWSNIQNEEMNFRNRSSFDNAYDAMPDYASGYTGHIPTNLWTSCKRDSRKEFSDVRCPLKAYPLSCSEYGSQCLDNRCLDEYSVHSNQSHGYGSNVFLNVSHHPNQYHSDTKSSKSCCLSCSKGGQCEGDRSSYFSVPQQSSTASCCSCSRDGPCESVQRSVYEFSKACCNPCTQSGTCESDLKSHYPSTNQSSRSSYSSCFSHGFHENARRNEPSHSSCCRFTFRGQKPKPYRKCGVIPNYMGYIPGLQMTFGEPYGITANRLLQRHFKEQENRHL